MYNDVLTLIERNKIEVSRNRPFNRESTDVFLKEIIQMKPIKMTKLRGRMAITFNVQEDEFMENFIILRAANHEFEYKVGNFSDNNLEFRGVVVYVPYGGREVFKGSTLLNDTNRDD